jgi:hypothetical protein
MTKALIVKIKELATSSGKGVYSKRDLLSLYAEIRSQGRIRLPQKITPEKFVKLFVEQGDLREIRFLSKYSRPPIRYVREGFSPYELAISLNKHGYLSHRTAAFLHRLIATDEDMIYVNKEQSPKPRGGGLTQESLNRAFSAKQRCTEYILRYKSFKIALLSGKYTRRLGVEAIQGQQGELVEVTSMERTLIDITVRPIYAGGVNEVLRSYVAAKGRVSPSKIVDLLKQLNYVYPYNQAIGFYMERAGYEETAWSQLKQDKLRYDFFLAHAMKKKIYDPHWQIYYPTSLQTVPLQV